MNLSWLGDHFCVVLRLVMNAAVSSGGQQCSGPPRSTKSQKDLKDQKDQEKQNDRYVCFI